LTRVRIAPHHRRNESGRTACRSRPASTRPYVVSIPRRHLRGRALLGALQLEWRRQHRAKGWHRPCRRHRPPLTGSRLGPRIVAVQAYDSGRFARASGRAGGHRHCVRACPQPDLSRGRPGVHRRGHAGQDCRSGTGHGHADATPAQRNPGTAHGDALSYGVANRIADPFANGIAYSNGDGDHHAHGHTNNDRHPVTHAITHAVADRHAGTGDPGCGRGEVPIPCACSRHSHRGGVPRCRRGTKKPLISRCRFAGYGVIRRRVARRSGSSRIDKLAQAW